ncbi:hypothetical protein FNYG_13836 [Fusarium nygamai]|uniref:Uncharacterized protein n=1 Tax=Gibberella nygamai TaxID=42673 RepID=A0A2K0UUL1_GIBNY|nr:hypothetical protein FNYG_13836 [Fusarium nygamai]
MHSSGIHKYYTQHICHIYDCIAIAEPAITPPSDLYTYISINHADLTRNRGDERCLIWHVTAEKVK